MSETDAEFVERMLADCETFGFDGLDIERMRSLARRGAAMQWRPIEEAPKDGPFVLLFNAASEAWCPTIARWNGDGWGDEEGTFHIPGLNMPTHWMPLPPPPKGAEE